jgi:hypothetical protein
MNQILQLSEEFLLTSSGIVGDQCEVLVFDNLGSPREEKCHGTVMPIVHHILVAGHRRFRVIEILSEERKGVSTYLANVHFDKGPELAFEMQQAENVYDAPKRAQQAITIWNAWCKEIATNSRPTLKQFAVKVGLSVDTVRRFIAFANLPVALQKMYIPEKPKTGLPFSVLVKLSHVWNLIKEDSGSEEKILYLAMKMVADNLTSREMLARIEIFESQLSQSSLIEDYQLDQGSLHIDIASSVDKHLKYASNHTARLRNAHGAGLFGESDNLAETVRVKVGSVEVREAAKVVADTAGLMLPTLKGKPVASVRRRLNSAAALVASISGAEQ